MFKHYHVFKGQNPLLVTIAKWIHLFPSRTEKLSTYTPTIVYAKIGSCQFFFFCFNFCNSVSVTFFIVFLLLNFHFSLINFVDNHIVVMVYYF